jgi:hypothetical protein
MNFSEQGAQSTLPQFSEITSRTNVTTSNYASSGNDPLQVTQNTIYTTATDLHSAKQILVRNLFLYEFI